MEKDYNIQLNTDKKYIKKLSIWPKVAIVIVNWNNYHATKRCLESLRNISYPNYRIYLIDNNSQDSSGKKLYIKFSSNNIVFIFNNKNLGFAGGCNEGIRKALDEGYDYILLLNNDCIVHDKEFLKNGISLAESNIDCGVVGGKILFWPNTKTIWSTGGYITYLSGEKHIGHKEIDRGRYNTVEKRQFISGALMLIKRRVFEKIGLLPDVYFFGKEEWEFSQRALKFGFQLYYCPIFSVYHEASNSHEWKDLTYVYNGTLSKILFKKRNLTKNGFRIWFFLYKAYLNFFFHIRYSLYSTKYLQGVSPYLLRRVMLDAVKDSSNVDKITEDMLDNYRRSKLTKM